MINDMRWQYKCAELRLGRLHAFWNLVILHKPIVFSAWVYDSDKTNLSVNIQDESAKI